MNINKMQDDILVTLDPNEYFVIARTFDRKHGGKIFYFNKRALKRFAADPKPYTLGEKDLNNVAFVSDRGENAEFEIQWRPMGRYNDGNFTQTFAINKDVIKEIDSGYRKILCHSREFESGHPKLNFSNSSKTIREIKKDKKTKRAFLKAIDKNFNWVGAKEIKFYPDGKCSFYFVEEMNDGKKGVTGGFIRHEYDGHVEYAMHT